MTDSFWTKVLWSRFIKHFRKLTDEQIIKDIHESMDALEDNDESGDSFGAKMVAWANERRNEKAAVASRENGNLGGRPKKNDEGAANGNNADCSTQHESAVSDSTTAFENLGSAKPSTDGDTREGSHDGKSGTSANLYGDAPHREAGDESATVSNPLALDMPVQDKCEQSAKTRDTRGSGRYQPPSLGPEDGNLYDQVPDKVSTDEKGGCGPLEKPNSQKSPQPSLFPVAKPEKRRYGKYRHVLLTDDEGRKLRESLGEDLEDAVAILDEYIQSLPVKAKGAKKNGAKWWMQEYEAKDHYIVLHHGWARKRLNEMRTNELNAKAAELRYSAAETNAKAAEKRLENANSSSQPRQMYLTSDDISRRNAEEGWRQLQLMHQMEGNG